MNAIVRNPQIIVDSLAQWGLTFLSELRVQLRKNAVLILISLLAYIGVYLSAFILEQPVDGHVGFYIKNALTFITPNILAVYLLGRATYTLVYLRPENLIGTYLKDVSTALRNPSRYARMIPLLLIASFSFFAFINFKIYIPHFMAFYADETFMRIDRFLHFGRLPSEWVAPILNSKIAVYKLDYLYKFWYLFMFGLWGWAAWGASDDGWRRQYVLSFILCWIIGGIVMATLLSSVGPCYYGDIVGGVNPYADQMAKLHLYNADTELMAVKAQALLWESHINPDAAFKSGISAMPSLHNTLAALFAIAAYKINRIFGHMMLIYTVIVFAGSVVLAWHYAIDGYVGFILAIAMWKLAGWLLKKQDGLLDKPT